MEPLFVNITVRDEAMMKEYLRKTFLLRPLSIFFYVLAAHYLLKTATVWFYFGYIDPIYLFVGVFIPPWYYFIYRRTLKLTLNRDLEANGGQPVTIEVSVTETSFFGRTKADAPEIAFSSVKKVTQTKNLIIVTTKAKQAFVLKKDGFTKGTAPELLQFLRDKGLKVKGK